MHTLIAILFGLAMLLITVVCYRSMAWSFDSPVLRRAVRTRQFGWWTRLGMLAVVIGIIWSWRLLGIQAVTPASVCFTLTMLLFGNAAVLFCSLVIEDVWEIFLHFADKVRGEASFEGIHSCPEEPANKPRACAEQISCADSHRACTATGFSHPMRSPDWRRTGQHR